MKIDNEIRDIFAVVGIILLLIIIIFGGYSFIKKSNECLCENDGITFTEPCSTQPRESLSEEDYAYCEDRNWTFMTDEEVDEIVEEYKIEHCPCYKTKK